MPTCTIFDLQGIQVQPELEMATMLELVAELRSIFPLRPALTYARVLSQLNINPFYAHGHIIEDWKYGQVIFVIRP